LGGFFVDTLDWRWIFWINLPLGTLVLFVTSSVPRRFTFHRSEHRIDFLGAGLRVAAVSTVMLAAQRTHVRRPRPEPDHRDEHRSRDAAQQPSRDPRTAQ